MLINGYDTYEVYLGQKREKGPARKADGNHYANFIKAVRSRKPETRTVRLETVTLSSALAHLATYLTASDRPSFSSIRAREIRGNDEANRMRQRELPETLRGAGQGLRKPRPPEAAACLWTAGCSSTIAGPLHDTCVWTPDACTPETRIAIGAGLIPKVRVLVPSVISAGRA